MQLVGVAGVAVAMADFLLQAVARIFNAIKVGAGQQDSKNIMLESRNNIGIPEASRQLVCQLDNCAVAVIAAELRY